MHYTGQDAPALMFGKYNGRCAQCVAENDPGYASWCLAQEGMRDRYPEVIDYWLALGITPMRYCAALLKDGTPCTVRATCGDKCKRHFSRDTADHFTAWESELISA